MIYTIVDYDYSVYTGQARVLVQRVTDEGIKEFHTIHFPLTPDTKIAEVQRVIEERIKVKSGALEDMFTRLDNLSWRSDA